MHAQIRTIIRHQIRWQNNHEYSLLLSSYLVLLWQTSQTTRKNERTKKYLILLLPFFLPILNFLNSESQAKNSSFIYMFSKVSILNSALNSSMEFCEGRPCSMVHRPPSSSTLALPSSISSISHRLQPGDVPDSLGFEAKLE